MRSQAMAGRPKMRALETTISEKPGGEDWLYEQLADGVTVGELAAQLGISRRYLYMWRDQPNHRDRRREMWSEAIRISAEVDADLIGVEFDRLDRVIATDEEGNPVRRIPHSAEVALATGRAKFRQWRAACKDPERFGRKDRNVNVTVSVQQDHLAAIKRAKQLRPRPPEHLTALPVGEESSEPPSDFEVVEVDE
jgi:hypothetical protein